MGIKKHIESGKEYLLSLAGGKSLTSKVNINIGISFALRAVSIIVSFLTITFSLQLLDTNKYGIWLAISTTVSWISILDIGLANGLRNKIAEYIAIQDFKSAKIAVSSTYVILMLIMLPIAVIFAVTSHYINWNSVFKTQLNEQELLYTIITVFIGLTLQFILKPISSILQGDQKIYKANQIQLFCNLAPLIPIILMAKLIKGSIFYLAIAQTILPVFVLLIYTLILFRKQYANISPSLKFIDLKKSQSLFKLSFAFFIVQIAYIFQYSTTEIIVTREFGGEDVTLYNLLFKYYSTVGIVFGIILTSYWSAFTNAFALSDFGWIKSSLSKLNKIALLLVAGLVIQVIIVVPVFKIWASDMVKVPLLLSLYMAIYSALNLFVSIYIIALNGTGKIKMQSIASIVSAALHIPLVLFFIRYCNFGLSSIIYSNLLWIAIQGILYKREIGSILRIKTKVQASDLVTGN